MSFLTALALLVVLGLAPFALLRLAAVIEYDGGGEKKVKARIKLCATVTRIARTAFLEGLSPVLVLVLVARMGDKVLNRSFGSYVPLGSPIFGFGMNL